MRWMIPLSAIVLALLPAPPSAKADSFGAGANAFTINFGSVGSTRNFADTNGVGSVPYYYRISTYEISQDDIAKATAGGLAGVTAGAWTGSRPAANVSWHEAAAFVNWLNTSKGYQAAYNLAYTNGSWSMEVWGASDAWTSGGTNLYRHKDARYFIPSENEWYKAGHYDPIGSNYFLYPTGSDTPPVAVVEGTDANTAVYSNVSSVPAAVNSAGGLSPNGTMGQGGNVIEWMETSYTRTNTVATDGRLIRGGAWDSSDYYISSEGRFGIIAPFGEFNIIGFRVASTSDVYESPLILVEAASRWPFDSSTAANWGASGDEWSVDLTVSHDGVDSVKAQTTDGQSTYRERTVTGPAVVDFWWKVSSEKNYDKFSYSLNGVNQETISGEVDWAYRTLTLPAGSHTIRWTYSKDESGAVGQDAGWLDDFVVYPATAALQVRDGATLLSGTDTVDFGSADLGSAGFTKSLTLLNEGYVPLEVQFSLPDGSPFTFEDGSAVYELLLGRDESLDVPIVLSTQAAGTQTALLTILAPDSTIAPPAITLTGYVRGPDIGVAQGGSALTSGQTFDMGLTPRTVEFAIRNNGNSGDLVISAISATGNFQITQQPAMTIPPQTSTTFKVLAQNVASGVQAGSVSITSNAGNLETFSLTLTSKSLISVEGIADGSMATSGTGGATAWDFAATTLPSGQSGQALKTGTTPNNGGSVLEFTTQTAGVVSWSWKVSTQEDFDWLLCEVDGQETAGISTKNGVWQTQVVQVPAGANVRWVYRKDGSGNIGEDAGYLADVEFRSLAANQSFNQWAQSNGIYNPQQRMPKSGVQAMFAWLGRFGPGDPDGDNRDEIVAAAYQPIYASGRLTYRYSVSKTADGTQQILYSPDMTSWTTRRFSQRVVSEDANRMVVEATAPSGAKGFFKVVGGGDTAPKGMVVVQGGTLPQASALAGTAVATFQIGKTEVSRAEWQEVRDWAVARNVLSYDLQVLWSPAGSSGNHPVTFVDWYDAAKWCNAKSEKEGLTPAYRVLGANYSDSDGMGAIYRWGRTAIMVNGFANGYRLPTEAEWEWAARGGVSSQGYIYSGSNEANAVAWHRDSSSAKAVGTKAPNELGLHDMSGNVFEWCEDIVGANRRLRGGSWGYDAAFGAVSNRDVDRHPDDRYEFIGFRVARNAVVVDSGPPPLGFLVYSPSLWVSVSSVPVLMVPTITGSVEEFFISPALPIGLHIDPLSGVISGAPQSSGYFTHTVTAANSRSASTTTVTIHIIPSGD